jgi:hypothetical protein
MVIRGRLGTDIIDRGVKSIQRMPLHATKDATTQFHQPMIQDEKRKKRKRGMV